MSSLVNWGKSASTCVVGHATGQVSQHTSHGQPRPADARHVPGQRTQKLRRGPRARVAELATSRMTYATELTENRSRLGGTRFATERCVPFQFEWDPDKAAINFTKHGVTFDQGRQIFDSPLSQTVLDLAHSLGERRFRTIGLAPDGQLLVVFHTDRGDTIRIIGARRATRREQHDYEENP